MRLIGFIVLAFLVPTLSVSFCSAEPSTSKFKVAILIPLSGPVSEFGIAIKNGYELAIQDTTPASTGCDFVIEDSEYNSTKSVTIFHELVASGVNLVYAFGGPMGEILAPIAETRKIPLLIDGIDPLTTKGRDYVLRLTNPANEYADKMVDYLIKKNHRRVVIVQTDNQYLGSLANGINRRRDEFEYFDIINVPVGEFDFKPILPKIFINKLDAIGFFMLPGQSSSLAKLLKTKRSQYLFFGTNFIASKNELEASHGTLEGALYTSNFVTKDFRARYMNKYSNDSAIKFAGEAYDALTLISKEICAKDHKVTNQEVMRIFKSGTNRTGALGDTIYREDSNGDKYLKPPVHIMKVSSAGFSPVEE